MLLVIGDFNAHLGTDRTGIARTLGPFSNPAPRNSLGDRVIDLCSQHNLFISNTYFKHKQIHRDTFRHSDNRTSQLLDLVLVRQRFRTSILDTRVHRKLRSLVQSDHEHVVCKIRLKLTTLKRHTTPKYDTDKLARDPELKRDFTTRISELLPDTDTLTHEDPESIWSALRDSVQQAANDSLPKQQKFQKHWMTEELLKLINEKAEAFAKVRDTPKDHPHHVIYKAAYKHTKNQCKIETRKARENSWKKEAEELEENMKKHNTRPAFSSLRKFSKGKTSPTDNIKSKAGKILTDPKSKLERWKEFYTDLLSCDQKIDESVFDTVQTADAPENEPPPTIEEVEEAVKRLKNRKSPGKCQITAEMLKFGGQPLTKFLHTLITAVWNTEDCPQEWRDAVIVTIFKKKDPTICDNYRGISLLSIPGKVFAMILLNRVSTAMEATVSEYQAGFRRGRSTTDQVFTLQQILTNSYEFNIPTHTCFIDLKKAYDTVNRTALWRVLQKTTLSHKVLRLLENLHTNTHASVRAYGQLSDPFPVTNGVRQGCVLAPALFNIFLDHILRVALANSPDGITIRYTKNNPRITINNRVTRSEEFDELIRELEYADDMAIICDSAAGLSRLVIRLDQVTQAWGLCISQEKTKILTIDRTANAPTPNITLRGEQLECVDTFKYLGRNFTTTPTLDKEIATRIQSASTAFYKLAAPLYRRKEISLRNKLRVYKATVLPTLLYGSETWAPNRDHTRRLEAFQHRCLRYCLGIRYATHGHISNSSLRQKCRPTPIATLMCTRRLRWLGHIARMPNTRLTKKILFSRLPNSRPGGRPFKSWRQVIVDDLGFVGLTQNNWVESAQDRKEWRKIINRPYRQHSNRPRRSTRVRRMM